MKLTKIAVVLVVSLLTFSLAACSAPKDSEATSTSGNTDIATLLATQPKNAEEATELHQKLMQKENGILSSNSKLWEKVFLSANKDMPMIEDGKNYGDFLLDTIEGAKDQFSAEELKTLKTGAQQVKEIEDKLAALEKDFPGCGSSPSSGESVDASSAGMPNSAGAATSAGKFPSFQGKDLDDNEVREAVKKIITEKVHENDNLDVKKFLMGSIELTTLKTTDSEESVLAFTERVNQFDEAYGDLPHVATICVYPCFAKVVSETLEVDGVEVACVSGSFPSSQALIEVKVAETALAIKDGATEIDIVMPVGKFLSADYEGVCDDIAELKAACGESVAMKVILETGALKTASNIKKASILSM